MFFLTQINVQKCFAISLVRTKSQRAYYVYNNYTIIIKVFEDHIKFKNRTESLFFKRIMKKM